MNSQNDFSQLEFIKKNILYDTLAYNIHEQQLKDTKKRQAREEQKQGYQMINRRVSTELQEDTKNKMNKKAYIQHLLSQEYEKQIQEQKRKKQEERRVNLGYAVSEEGYQRNFEQKRARDLARIYKGQKTYKMENPQVKEIKNQIINKNQSQSRISNQAVTESDDIHSPYGYGHYLKSQIERKRSLKQQEKRNKYQNQQILVKKNEDSLTKEIEEHRKYQMNQKMMFKRSLDAQIHEKRNLSYHY